MKLNQITTSPHKSNYPETYDAPSKIQLFHPRPHCSPPIFLFISLLPSYSYPHLRVLWYYVENLTATQLQQRYLQEHGVYAHHQVLLNWVSAPAQAPERLENDNECIHQHACGEYILEQLQNGANGLPHGTRNRPVSLVYLAVRASDTSDCHQNATRYDEYVGMFSSLVFFGTFLFCNGFRQNFNSIWKSQRSDVSKKKRGCIRKISLR